MLVFLRLIYGVIVCGVARRTGASKSVIRMLCTCSMFIYYFIIIFYSLFYKPKYQTQAQTQTTYLAIANINLRIYDHHN